MNGRPRRRPQMDEGTYVPYQQNEKLVVPAFETLAAINERARAASIRSLGSMHHTPAAGYRDPLSVLHVIDALQRWSPEYYIRAKYISAYLNHKQDAVFFDPITVGKIMADIIEVADEAYADNALLSPLETEMDYKGRAYFINSLPTTYKWLWRIRTQVEIKAQTSISWEREGALNSRMESVFAELDTTAVLT